MKSIIRYESCNTVGNKSISDIYIFSMVCNIAEAAYHPFLYVCLNLCFYICYQKYLPVT